MPRYHCTYFITGHLYRLNPSPFCPCPTPPAATTRLFSVFMSSLLFIYLFLLPDSGRSFWTSRQASFIDKQGVCFSQLSTQGPGGDRPPRPVSATVQWDAGHESQLLSPHPPPRPSATRAWQLRDVWVTAALTRPPEAKTRVPGECTSSPRGDTYAVEPGRRRMERRHLARKRKGEKTGKAKPGARKLRSPLAAGRQKECAEMVPARVHSREHPEGFA